MRATLDQLESLVDLLPTAQAAEARELIRTLRDQSDWQILLTTWTRVLTQQAERTGTIEGHVSDIVPSYVRLSNAEARAIELENLRQEQELRDGEAANVVKGKRWTAFLQVLTSGWDAVMKFVTSHAFQLFLVAILSALVTHACSEIRGFLPVEYPPAQELHDGSGERGKAPADHTLVVPPPAP